MHVARLATASRVCARTSSAAYFAPWAACMVLLGRRDPPPASLLPADSSRARSGRTAGWSSLLGWARRWTLVMCASNSRRSARPPGSASRGRRGNCGRASSACCHGPVCRSRRSRGWPDIRVRGPLRSSTGRKSGQSSSAVPRSWIRSSAELIAALPSQGSLRSPSSSSCARQHDRSTGVSWMPSTAPSSTERNRRCARTRRTGRRPRQDRLGRRSAPRRVRDRDQDRYLRSRSPPGGGRRRTSVAPHAAAPVRRADARRPHGQRR